MNTLQRPSSISKIPQWAANQTTCSICLDDFAQQDWVKKMSCHHLFHTDCVKSWIEKEKNCPTCRHQITWIDLRPSYHFGDEHKPIGAKKNSCEICQSPSHGQDQLIRLKCEHLFHKECLKPFLPSLACPLCQRQMSRIKGPSKAQLVLQGTLILLSIVFTCNAARQERFFYTTGCSQPNTSPAETACSTRLKILPLIAITYLTLAIFTSLWLYKSPIKNYLNLRKSTSKQQELPQ